MDEHGHHESNEFGLSSQGIHWAFLAFEQFLLTTSKQTDRGPLIEPINSAGDSAIRRATKRTLWSDKRLTGPAHFRPFRFTNIGRAGIRAGMRAWP